MNQQASNQSAGNQQAGMPQTGNQQAGGAQSGNLTPQGQQELASRSATEPQTTAGEQARHARDRRSMVPRVDVIEDESGITLLADLPGVPKDGVELKIEGDTLMIEGNVTTPTPEGLRSVYAEVRIPRYRRAFTLSRELDAGHIEANMKDGVLNLRIPKQEHAKPRRISVGAG